MASDAAERPVSGDGPTVLAFLTSSCTECRGWWDGLAAGRRPGAATIVVVTPDPALESRRAVRRLGAAAGVEVVMSTPTWTEHGVRGAPWFVVLRDGAVSTAGRAATWTDLDRLVGG